MLGNVALRHRLPEAGPAGAGVELRRGVEQRLPATDTLIDTVFLRVPVRPRECSFGSFLSGDLELFWRQKLPPFLIRLLNFFGHGYTSSLNGAADPVAGTPKLSLQHTEVYA